MTLQIFSCAHGDAVGHVPRRTAAFSTTTILLTNSFQIRSKYIDRATIPIILAIISSCYKIGASTPMTYVWAMHLSKIELSYRLDAEACRRARMPDRSAARTAAPAPAS